jgi:NADH-quinone oxidoreductase subunit C
MDTNNLIAWIKVIPGVTAVEMHGGDLWVEAPVLDVEAMGLAMNAHGIRLGTVTGTPVAEDGETDVIYHYIAGESLFINVRTRTRNGALASLATIARPAAWAEREIKDLLGVTFPGHPDPRPLLRPPGFEDGMFRAPMSKSRQNPKQES